VSIPPCSKCGMPNTYPDGVLYICADCGYEWSAVSTVNEDEDTLIVKDSNGTILSDGDSVVIIKDLKVKGSSTTLKVGTKIKSIRLVGGDHEVDCKTDQGQFMLKACFLRKTSV
jgi:protein PhnA